VGAAVGSAATPVCARQRVDKLCRRSCCVRPAPAVLSQYHNGPRLYLFGHGCWKCVLFGLPRYALSCATTVRSCCFADGMTARRLAGASAGIASVSAPLLLVSWACCACRAFECSLAVCAAGAHPGGCQLSVCHQLLSVAACTCTLCAAPASPPEGGSSQPSRRGYP
jgi:hypothetical protein